MGFGKLVTGMSIKQWIYLIGGILITLVIIWIIWSIVAYINAGWNEANILKEKQATESNTRITEAETNEFQASSLIFHCHASNFSEIEAFSSSYMRFKMGGGTTKFQLSNAAGVSSYLHHAFLLRNNSATNIALEIELASGQSDPALEINSSSNNTEFQVDPSGGLSAGQTNLHLYDEDNGALEQVTVGAADSGGTGFKVLD